MPKAQLHHHKAVSPKRILSAVAALLVAFLLLTSVVGLARKYIAIRSRVSDLKAQEAMLIEKQSTLKQTNEYFKSPEGQERELRSKYNIVRPGEGMIVITAPNVPTAIQRPESRVGRWWDSILRGLGIRKK